MYWYFEVLKKYAKFEGRARRQEYWYFQLFNLLVVIGSALVLGFVTGFVEALNGTTSSTTDDNSVLDAILGLYFLAVFLPTLAVSVRRLHDTGRSGWWILVGALPLVGGLIQLIFFVEDSQAGQNEYGPNPKEVASIASVTRY